MKTFLETIKQKWANYLLEIIVIIIGILCAFALNNWNDSRIERRIERELLLSLNSEIALTISELERIISHQSTGKEATINLLLLFGEQNRIIDKIQIDTLIDISRLPTTFNAPLGLIKSIISTGELKYIRNSEIRNFITSFEDAIINDTESNVTMLRIWENQLEPRLDKHFIWLTEASKMSWLGVTLNPSLHKTDYYGLMGDPILENLFAKTLFYQTAVILQEKRLLKKTKKMMEIINQELDKFD